MHGRHMRPRSLAAMGLVLGALLVPFLSGCSNGSEPAAGQSAEAEATLSANEFSHALLELRIRAGLLEHLRADALSIGIGLDGDTVTLTGHVSDASHKMLARETALSIEGVRQVNNEITVGQPDETNELGRLLDKLDREASDALLETRLKTRLVEELGQVAFDIQVEATEGTVSLRGRVPDKDRRRLAMKVVESVSGVEEVHNYLSVQA